MSSLGNFQGACSALHQSELSAAAYFLLAMMDDSAIDDAAGAVKGDREIRRGASSGKKATKKTSKKAAKEVAKE